MIKWLLNELLEVDSTQNVLRNLALAGVAEGTVVVARRQTAGRGRHGREWVSPEGGLYMSLLLRPPSSANLRTLTLASSLAVVNGIKAASGLNASIRWPNDVMVAGKKLAGVLAESSYMAQSLTCVAIGIGVNCNSKLAVEDRSNQATSLGEQTGKQVDMVRLRQAILEAFTSVHERWLNGENVVEAAREFVGTLGKRVVISMKSGGSFDGVAKSIEPTGDLVVEEGSRKRVVRAEDVALLREA